MKTRYVQFADQKKSEIVETEQIGLPINSNTTKPQI